MSIDPRHPVRPRAGRTIGLAVAVLAAVPVSAMAAEPSPGPEPTAVALRMEVGGGFVPQSIALMEMPSFTLYADGTAIYRGPWLEGQTWETPPAFRVTHLDEEMTSQFLAAVHDPIMTVGPSGLESVVADAPTTTFTFDDGTDQRTVSIYALGFERPDSPQDPALTALSTLAASLADFESWAGEHGLTTETYAPDAYLGMLVPTAVQEIGLAAEWRLSVPMDDFVTPDDGWVPQAVLTSDQVAELIPVPNGGVLGLVYADGHGGAVELVIRPLLPDER
ncbi:MAG: hypothetical protein KF809_00720 [Chloroflexi bacterium]|nr:hypothetical protein [Chloroflexota bacterium]